MFKAWFVQTTKYREVAMGNKIEEYKKQFEAEESELIVRISWGWQNRSVRDKYYETNARFDKALNVKTGEQLGMGVVHHITGLGGWLLNKYGYKLKEGHTYRILAREGTPKGDRKFQRSYYLEKILEKDVNEPGLDALKIFENKFEEAVTDLTVLIKQEIVGWACESNYRRPMATFIASIDHKTNEINTSCGKLAWMEKDRKSKIKFNFEAMRTYHVKVRRNKEDKDSYLLVDVVKKVKDNRLESIKENYLKPVIITSELGQFRLDRNHNRFKGQIDYLGENCSINLEVVEGETTADRQLDKLYEIFKDLENWDNCVKEYAVNELLETANDWNEDEAGEITKEQFVKRIGTPLAIEVGRSGNVVVPFDDDDMFAGHIIEIYIDENGKFEGVNLVG